ncbi:MAG: hypothetical protein K9N52_06815 [Verrucomicrobia bacterium]|nr:hypothetical protein [Verrucomicrobiota bacterium]
MRKVYINGTGCVSPAGWGVDGLHNAVFNNSPAPVHELERPGWEEPLKMRAVPRLSPPPAFLRHPRLRRSSPLTHYAASAVFEALKVGGANPDLSVIPQNTGILVCLQSGCVHYSYRFFNEALDNPATASPLLFPETVYSAPASHLACILQRTEIVYTLVGDPATFLRALALGAGWIAEGRLDACLVVGAEELNWLLADALWHFDHHAVPSAGAGALFLSAFSECSDAIELALVTDAFTYNSRLNRHEAAVRMREALPPGSGNEVLCDGREGRTLKDKIENSVWSGWPGARFSPKATLGEGFMAAGAWLPVTACEALKDNRYTAANVSVVGNDQQAIGARFIRHAGAGEASSRAPAGDGAA